MKLQRKTSETTVTVEIGDDGNASSNTGVPFLDHMMSTLAKYSGVGFVIDTTGDLKHHLVEDVAITVGAIVREITPAKCARFAESTVAMDDALVHVVIDAGGRFYYEGALPGGLYDHWMRSFAENARITLHIRVLRGRDRHHIVECAFKALGFALRSALVEGDTVFSTKGAVQVERQ